MIHITPENLARFKEVHLRETGQELTDGQAREYGERVLRLVAFAAQIELSPL